MLPSNLKCSICTYVSLYFTIIICVFFSKCSMCNLHFMANSVQSFSMLFIMYATSIKFLEFSDFADQGCQVHSPILTCAIRSILHSPTDRSQPTNPSPFIWSSAIAQIIITEWIHSICVIAFACIIAIDSIHCNQSIDRNWPIATNRSISIDLKQGNRLNHRRRLDPINSRNHTCSYHRWKFLKQELVSQEFLNQELVYQECMVQHFKKLSCWTRIPGSGIPVLCTPYYCQHIKHSF